METQIQYVKNINLQLKPIEKTIKILNLQTINGLYSHKLDSFKSQKALF